MPAHIKPAGDMLSGRGRGGHVEAAALYPRDGKSSVASSAGFVVAIVAALVLAAALGAFFLLRSLRLSKSRPTYLPGAWLKRKWWSWTPSSSRHNQFSALSTDRSASRPSSHADTLNVGSRSGILDTLSGSAQSDRASTLRNDATDVDRHESVRSIITLPAYSASARESEQVIGREGERAGIDTVVEFPETADEEEARREEEMEALFQIRQARRVERASRDQRRRLRREARARGDAAAVEELRQQDRQARAAAAAADSSAIAATATASSDNLMQEHRSRERGRRVSSVSYMDLGVARHDGSRVRANSGDSDRQPLMDGAAHIDGRSRAGSGSQTLGTAHLRNVSSSSLSRFVTSSDLSDDDRSSADFEIVPTPPRRDSLVAAAQQQQGASASRTPPRLRLPSVSSGTTTTAESRPRSSSLQQAPSGPDTASSGLPQYDDLSPVATAPAPAIQEPVQPAHTPGTREPQTHQHDLGEAPAYESPSTTNAPRIPAFARLPSIRVTPFSPESPLAGGERSWPDAGAASSSAATAPPTSAPAAPSAGE